MIDNVHDEFVEGVQAPRAIPRPKRVDLERTVDLMTPHRPLLPGGRSFSTGHKHWLLEFKTSGIAEGGKEERLTEIMLKEISPFNLTLEKVGAQPFHAIVNPEIECNTVALKHNGHSFMLLNDKPNFKAIAPKLGELLRNQIVYVRNMRQFESVVQRQMKEEGFPEFSKLFYDLVDVKQHAIDLNLTSTNKIVEVWKALGIEVRANETRTRVLIDTLQMGLALMREKLPADAFVLPLTATDPRMAEQILIKTGSKSSPVQESLALDFGNSPSVAEEQRKPDVQQAREQSAPSGSSVPGKDGIKRRPNRGCNAKDVAMREHVVCIRHPTPREIESGPHNLGESPILHISSRTGGNIFDLTSPLVLFHKRFSAGQGSQRKANQFRDAIADIYELAGYRRYTEAPPKAVVSRKPGAVRKPRPSEVPSIHEHMALTLRAILAVPLSMDVKMAVLEALEKRIEDPVKVGVPLGGPSPLPQLLAKIRSQVTGDAPLDEEEPESDAPNVETDRMSQEDPTDSPEEVAPETSEVEEQSIATPEVQTPEAEELPRQTPVADPQPLVAVLSAFPIHHAAPIIARGEPEFTQPATPMDTILNTPYATLCARHRDMDDVIQDLVKESRLARAQADILLAHAAKKEDAARRLAASVGQNLQA